MSTIRMSGNALRELPEKLAKKEKDLKSREIELNNLKAEIESQNIETKAEYETKFAKLIAMEKEIKNQCIDLDTQRADLEKKKNDLKMILEIQDGKEAFKEFYNSLNHMYTIWFGYKGSSKGLFEAITKIIEARNTMEKVDADDS
jgi:DNA repair exonuclease SbcCD ATPase subunit